MKLTKRMETILGIAASIENMANMGVPDDAQDLLSRLRGIEVDAARIQRLINMPSKRKAAALSLEQGEKP